MQILQKLFLIALTAHLLQVLLVSQVSTAAAKAIDVKATYRLCNDYSGPDKFLTISENDVDLNMVDATRDPKQLWKFVALNDGKFRMINLSDEEKSVDVQKRGNVYAVVMADLGDSSGQMWGFVTQSDGKLRFSNGFAGDDRSLDVHKNGDVWSVVVGDSGNYSGQAWTLTKVTRPRE